MWREGRAGWNCTSHAGHGALAGIAHCSIPFILSFPCSHPWATRTPLKHQLCCQVKPELGTCCLGWLGRARGRFPPQLSVQTFLVLHHSIFPVTVSGRVWHMQGPCRALLMRSSQTSWGGSTAQVVPRGLQTLESLPNLYQHPKLALLCQLTNL